MKVNLTKLIVHVYTTVQEQQVQHDVYEGEVSMSQAQQDYYKNLLGDQNASVTVSRELSESNYGNGGKVFVSITLTCDQSVPVMLTAIEYAKGLAEETVWKHHTELRNQLQTKGLIR
jgi:hypothetical protein